MRKVNLAVKRTVDVMVSIVGLLLLSPLLLATGLIIKFTSAGRAIFRQERVGKDGEVFEILKFRTMVENAENLGDGILIESEEDPRITRVGRLLRSTALDELPQLWNVLAGDMSLVGPRPPVPYYPSSYEEYSDFQRRRFVMRPGITGLAQVAVRNSAEWDERMLLDVEYVEKFSLWLDIRIIWGTFRVLVTRKGVY